MPITEALMDSSNSPTQPQRVSRRQQDLKGKGKALADHPSDVPAPILLLRLPALLLHPPDHPNHVGSLHASLDALRKCLALHSSLGGNGSGSLSLEQEMRAYGMTAEVGLKVIAAGLGGQDGPSWASDIDQEIDEAISQGTRLCQRITSLREHRHYFSLLRAHLQLWQHQFKACRALLKREIASLTAADSSATAYACYLTYVSALTSSTSTQSPDYPIALTALEKMQSLATTRGDEEIVALCLSSRLQILMRAGMWELVGETCEAAEAILSLSFNDEATKEEDSATMKTASPASPLRSTLCQSTRITVLMLGIVYHTHICQPKLATARLTKLHELLDSDALDEFPDGTISVTLASGPPMPITVTHPRVVCELAYLISGICRRDVAGRKPKRKLFVKEGLVTSAELEKIVTMPLLGSIRDMQEVEERLDKIRADLLCESVSISVMRSDFVEADETLSELIAHTRTTHIFESFAPQITLLSAHLAHALGQTVRALDCYRVAAFLDKTKGAVRLAARVGEVVLRTGLPKGADRGSENSLKAMTLEVIRECRSFDAEFEPVGKILEAVVAREITGIKKSLKAALDIVARSSDNHLRALILALMANMYILTASDHAQLMLKTCQQLAAGLGAPLDKADELANGGTAAGNVPLGLWVGEKFAELYRRAGKDDKAKRQAELNERLQLALDRLRKHAEAGNTSGSTTVVVEEDEDAMEVDRELGSGDEEKMDTSS